MIAPAEMVTGCVPMRVTDSPIRDVGWSVVGGLGGGGPEEDDEGLAGGRFEVVVDEVVEVDWRGGGGAADMRRGGIGVESRWLVVTYYVRTRHVIRRFEAIRVGGLSFQGRKLG